LFLLKYGKIGHLDLRVYFTNTFIWEVIELKDFKINSSNTGDFGVVDKKVYSFRTTVLMFPDAQKFTKLRD